MDDQNNNDNNDNDNSQSSDQSSVPADQTNTDQSAGSDQAAQDQTTTDNAQTQGGQASDGGTPTDNSVAPDAATTNDTSASVAPSLSWDADTGTWKTDTGNQAVGTGTDENNPWAGVNPNTDVNGNPVGDFNATTGGFDNVNAETGNVTQTGAVLGGNLMLDPNNAGGVAEWAPAQTGAGLARSDLAGTWAVPGAQAVANASGQPVMDQAMNTVNPAGMASLRGSEWNPATPADTRGVSDGHGAPPGAPVPGNAPAAGAGTLRGPGFQGGGYTLGPGAGPATAHPGYGAGGGAYAGSINVNPNISPVFNNYAGGAGGAGAGRVAAAARNPVRGAGYFGSMASGSPDVWYSLQGNNAPGAPAAAPTWGNYNFDASTGQPTQGIESNPWHPLSDQDAAAINAAAGLGQNIY